MKLTNKRKINRLLALVGVAGCLLLGVVLGAFWFYQDDLPPTSELRNYTLRTGSEVYDRNGRMIYLFAFEKRKLVSLKELPPHLVDALLVTEDKRFYGHFGIDLLSNIRALIVDLRTRDFSQGASTITQQMARNMFLTLDKRISRKMKEIVLSLRIEASFSKDEILEIYFNKIFWGGQIHGVETASLYYFGKHARDLSLPESAMLVGMIQRPNYYDPIKRPENAKPRRDYVLQRMFKEKKISEAEYLAAVSSPLKPDPGEFYRFSSDYFIEHIRVYLERKYGTERLFEGGLRIYTTLDFELSAYADSVMNSFLSSVENSRGYRNKYSQVDPTARDIETRYIQGGLVLMENDTGYVRVLLGGRNFDHSKFNRMTQARRQAGSSIKPTYYTLAVEKGYTPATVINDAPITLGVGTQRWTPHNYNRQYNGFTRMRVALQWSYNVWAVKCAVDIGLDTLNEAFERFGLSIVDRSGRRKKVTDYSAALGSYEVVPIELISGYTTFGNEGVRVTPVFITKVEDTKGTVLERGNTQKIRVCSPEVAYIMTSMLQSVTQSGTGAGSRSGYYWQNAGKTGTSENHVDSWFIGFNNSLTLGIWTGFDNTSAGYGSPNAVSMWGPIMTKAIRLDNKGRTPKSDDPRYNFEVPKKIVKQRINSISGFAVEEDGIEEVFIEGNLPPAVADTLQYNFYPTRWGYQDQFEQD